MKNKFTNLFGSKFVTGSSLLAGLVLVTGLTWGLAESVKSTKATTTDAATTAISVSDEAQCEKPKADCHKHGTDGEEKTSESAGHSETGVDQAMDADCPRKENCPKGAHGAKSGDCCKKPMKCCKKNSVDSKKTGSSKAAEIH